MDNHFVSYRIEDRSYVALVKREIRTAARIEAFTEKQRAEIDIIVSEITSNVVKHVGSGEILYRVSNVERSPVFEILAIDNGPGISDLSRMIKDGASTTQTLGQGLGAIERLSTVSGIYTMNKWGTIVYARVANTKVTASRTALDADVRTLIVTKPREVACGDGFRMKRTKTGIKFFLGDGLGHGEHAKAAVDKAGECFMKLEDEDPVDILRQMHEAARRTRGLVCSVATLDLVKKQWKLCGVGNIMSRLYSGIEYKNYISYNGTLGLNIPASMRTSVVRAERNQSLFMCSDGIRSRWELLRYPAIMRHDSGLVAAALYKDFNRGNDDASILIAKVM